MQAMSQVRALAFAVAASVGATGTASADTWKFGAGVDYTSGDYGGADDITTTYVPVTVSYETARWGVRAAVPYVQVSGPTTFIDANGQIVSGPDRTDRGLGDVLMAATLYNVVSLTEQRFYIDLTARIKLGTADVNKGLGTGETDYSVQMDWGKDFDRFGLFGMAGYKVYGDPASFNLDDAAYASIGADYQVSSSKRAGLIFDVRQSATPGNDSLRELILFAVFGDDAAFAVQPYILAGMSESSPNWGGGIFMRWKTQAR